MIRKLDESRKLEYCIDIYNFHSKFFIMTIFRYCLVLVSKELLFILLFFFRCKYFFVVTSNVRLVRSLTFFFYFAKTGLSIKYRALIDGYISNNIILINDNAYSSLQILITLQFRLIILINLTQNFSHIQIVDSFIPCPLYLLSV